MSCKPYLFRCFVRLTVLAYLQEAVASQRARSHQHYYRPTRHPSGSAIFFVHRASCSKPLTYTCLLCCQPASQPASSGKFLLRPGHGNSSAAEAAGSSKFALHKSAFVMNRARLTISPECTTSWSWPGLSSMQYPVLALARSPGNRQQMLFESLNLLGFPILISSIGNEPCFDSYSLPLRASGFY